MAVPNTQWTKQAVTTTRWFGSSEEITADAWDSATDTWDNATDTWDVIFDTGTPERPTPTQWTKVA